MRELFVIYGLFCHVGSVYCKNLKKLMLMGPMSAPSACSDAVDDVCLTIVSDDGR